MHAAYFETLFAVAEPSADWPSDFAIITAYAPTGDRRTDEQNATADQQLESHLRDLAEPIRRLTGYSPSSGHAEPGWAVAMAWQKGCDLGTEYLQDAIYFVSGNELQVTHCDSRRELVHVGTFRDRLASTIPAHQ